MNGYSSGQNGLSKIKSNHRWTLGKINSKNTGKPNHMKSIVSLFILVLLTAGCEHTRSISDSGYHSERGWRSADSFGYKGELSETDILGAAPKQDATEANIAKALTSAAAPKLKRGDKIILIQSGAFMPDNLMLDEASKYFSVAPFSGMPPAEKTGFSESLRLRAAQGGYGHIICYWGTLESAEKDREGKIVSWVPIVGSFVPDQRQEMRIRLKAITLEVASGNWKMVMPESHNDSGLNSSWSRENSDQKLVQSLKQNGYSRLLNSLLQE
jgi:hypothetical protein